MFVYTYLVFVEQPDICWDGFLILGLGLDLPNLVQIQTCEVEFLLAFCDLRSDVDQTL